jgi:hypothetical protein
MRWLDTLKRLLRGNTGLHTDSTVDVDVLKRMVRAIATTRPDEIGCAECFEEMDRFVDATLEGKSAAEAMPLVQDHLGRCGDCREEYEALLAAVRAIVLPIEPGA